jgi:hypothetical protein
MNDAPVLDQIDGQWMKFFAIALRKLGGKVTITMADVEAFDREYRNGTGGHLFTHGHKESFDFKIVSRAEAERLAAHESATNRGKA